MKSPKDMRIIQIDVTNACMHKCSNCTRFCGHHKKPFFMEYDFFKQAVDSLDGYKGTIGVMGGEPTLHPEFEKMAQYIGSKYPQFEGADRQMLHPQPKFMKAIQDLEFSHTCGYDSGLGKRQTLICPGLWSAMGKTYQKHYEVIQDVFKYQALNDHTNPMYHQPALITRKELQIPDEEWILLRDNCWVQNEWSATITPKGAFFCEVAGALDMLFDGPGGWKVEPGWWKRTPEEFGDQLHWCELCGLACKTFMRDANEELDDVSPVLYEKLLELESPRLRAGHVNAVKIENGEIAEESKAAGKRFSSSMPYTESYEARFSSTKSILYPEAFEAVYQFDQFTAEAAQRALDSMKRQFEKLYFICKDAVSAEACRGIAKEAEASCKVYNLENMDYGEILKDILQDRNGRRYLAIFSSGVYPKPSFAERMKQSIFNPGVLIYSESGEKTKTLEEWLDYDTETDAGRLVIFNGRASSLKGFEDRKLVSLEALLSCWNPEKMLRFDERLFYYPPETSIQENKRYAIYGGGTRLSWLCDSIRNGKAELVCIVDSDKEKQGMQMGEYVIQEPDYLREHMQDIDYVLIGSLYYYGEIKEAILKQGFTEGQLTFV